MSKEKKARTASDSGERSVAGLPLHEFLREGPARECKAYEVDPTAEGGNIDGGPGALRRARGKNSPVRIQNLDGGEVGSRVGNGFQGLPNSRYKLLENRCKSTEKLCTFARSFSNHLIIIK